LSETGGAAVRRAEVTGRTLVVSVLTSLLTLFGGGAGSGSASVPSTVLMSRVEPPGPAGVTSRIYWTEAPTGAASEHGTVAVAGRSGSGIDQRLLAGTTGGAGVAVDSRHVYWVNYGSGTIGRADLDGSHVDQRFITGASYPIGLAVSSHYIYWANSMSWYGGDLKGTIGRADLDGSEVDQRFIVAAYEVTGLAIDSQHIYWAQNASGSGSIGRADLNGAHIELDFVTGTNAPDGVAVNSRYLYWSNGGDDTIGRALLDGSHVSQHCVEPTAVPVGNELEGVATDGQYVYWTNYPGDSLGRADLDGTDVNSRFISVKGVPEGVTVAGPQRPVRVTASRGCAPSPEPIMLGVHYADMGLYAVGWGEAAPPTLSNGGASASGTISDIKWSSWGGPVAMGQGLNPIFKPQGGYYSKPAVIQLRVSDIRRCSPHGPLAYTKLETRGQARPGGTCGPWETAGTNLCTGEGI
jgi:virginiamycin B lyase